MTSIVCLFIEFIFVFPLFTKVQKRGSRPKNDRQRQADSDDGLGELVDVRVLNADPCGADDGGPARRLHVRDRR